MNKKKQVSSPSNAWEGCRICTVIPDGNYAINFIETGGNTSAVEAEILELVGGESQLSSGYKSWVVSCPECHTRYLAEVDVEPFVWDFTLERERPDGTAMTQFGEQFVFPD